MIARSIIMITILILLIATSGLSGDKSEIAEKYHIGTVIRAEPAGPYIYLLVNVEGREFWISTFTKYLPEDIASGNKIEYTGGQYINGFNSPSMAKSFSSMLMVSKIRVVRSKLDSN